MYFEIFVLHRVMFKIHFFLINKDINLHFCTIVMNIKSKKKK